MLYMGKWQSSVYGLLVGGVVSPAPVWQLGVVLKEDEDKGDAEEAGGGDGDPHHGQHHGAALGLAAVGPGDRHLGGLH